MLRLIKYYIYEYLEVSSRTPDMDDNDGYLSECLADLDDAIYYIKLWSIASCS